MGQPTAGANSELDHNNLTEQLAPKKGQNFRYAFGCSVLASVASILLGYDIGVMSGAAKYIKKDLNISDVEVEILLGILNLYSLVGSFAAGWTSDWLGRRYTIVFAATFFFAGALLMGFAMNYAFLMFGRLIAGIGVGYATMIAPVYTTEISPSSSRGFFASFPEVFINIGILLGYVSNYAFSHLSYHLGWRFMLGIGAIPSIFLSLTVLFLPESPRWLVLQNRLADAMVVLEKISNTTEEAEMRLANIKRAAGISESCKSDVEIRATKQSHGKGVWKELLLSPTPPVRRILLVAVGIHFFQQASGSDSVVLYSPTIFEKAGIHSDNAQLATTVAVGFTKTMFILVATILFDRVGRRPLLLSSICGMIVCLASLGLGLTVINQHGDEKIEWAVALSIASVLFYVSFFSIGLGPITSVYTSEIFPLRLRAQGVAVGNAVNRVTSSVITMTFISLYKTITIGGSFFLYGGIAVASLIFFYTSLPETRGKTLEETCKLFGLDTDEAEEEGNVWLAKASGSGLNVAM